MNRSCAIVVGTLAGCLLVPGCITIEEPSAEEAEGSAMGDDGPGANSSSPSDFLAGADDTSPSGTDDDAVAGAAGRGGAEEQPVEDPVPEQPATESFGVSVQPEQCSLGSTPSLMTAEGQDVTPEWTGCWIVWGGTTGDEGTTTSSVRVMLMPPNVMGSLAYPGARWLSVGVIGGTPGEYAATLAQDYAEDEARVIYVDTDDPEAADEIDIDDIMFSSSPFNIPPMPPGIHWADVGGSITLSSVDGSVGALGDDVLDDGGQVDVSLSLDGLQLTLNDGTQVTASGNISASGRALDPAGSGTGDGSDGSSADGGSTGGDPSPNNCDQRWGLPDDIQVYSQCQTACVYDDSRDLPENQNPEAQSQLDEVIGFSCAALAGFDPSYEAACPFCN
jgi:hypothetical protein